MSAAPRLAARPHPVSLCAAARPVVVALAALAAGAAPAPAAPPPSDGDGDASAAEEYRETVVVTATRTPTPRLETGSAVTVVEPDDAVPRHGRLALDLLRRVPGLDLRRNGGPGTETSLFLRGADSDHTLVLVDGVELNDPSTPSRTPFATHLTLDGVERIEVMRGPASPLYGGDAIGGVVHVITTPDGPPGRLRLWSEGGSYSSSALGFGYTDRIGGASLSISGSRSETGGFSASAAGTEDDPYDAATLATRVRAPLGPRASLDAVMRLTWSDADFDGFFAEAGHRIDATQRIVRLAPSFGSASGRWLHRLGVQYADAERRTSGDFPSDVRGELAKLDWLGRYEAGAGHRLLFGAEAEQERAELASFVDRAETRSVFVQDQLSIGRRWSATLGARHDDHDRFGGKTTWRAATAFRPGSEGLVVRASFGTAFKAPSLAELHPDAFGGNPGLGPETSTGADVGVELAPGRGRWAFGASLFWNAFDELIVAVFDPTTFTFENVNVDEARASGLELHASAVVGPRLSLRGQYTWTDTEATGNPSRFGLSDGSPLLRRPEHKGALGLDWRFAAERGGRLAVDLVHVGERKDVDPVTFAVADAPAHTVVDMLGGIGLGGGVSLTARLENVLDEEYEDVLGFATPGRSAYVGLSLELDTR